jgi:predicted PurR-regulated permease PerM
VNCLRGCVFGHGVIVLVHLALSKVERGTNVYRDPHEEQEDFTVAYQPFLSDRLKANQALEVSIYIGLAILLVAACLLILRPFIPLLVWGIVIAVAIYPGYKKLRALVAGRGILAASICTIALLAVVIIPTVLVTLALTHSMQAISVQIRNGSAVIPPPPASVESWPVIGAPLTKVWSLASQDVTEVLRTYAPQIKAGLSTFLSTSADVGLAVFQLLAAILVAGVLLAKADSAYRLTCALTRRVFGDKGPEFQELIGATIRSVTFGIIGVALIQSAFADAGFWVVGLPGLGLWAVIFVFAAVLQVGALVLIPAVIYVFATASTTTAVIFLVWCIVVGLMDNVLKPLLLGRGVAVPVVVVFCGAIGGFLVMRIIGLFVGAVVLSVGYKLFLAWLNEGEAPNQLS